MDNEIYALLFNKNKLLLNIDFRLNKTIKHQSLVSYSRVHKGSVFMEPRYCTQEFSISFLFLKCCSFCLLMRSRSCLSPNLSSRHFGCCWLFVIVKPSFDQIYSRYAVASDYISYPRRLCAGQLALIHSTRNSNVC